MSVQTSNENNLQLETQQQTEKTIEYKIDKKVFCVTPIYNNHTGIPIHEWLLNSMMNDVKKSL